jgi:ADP-ribosylglycohydrolase
MNYAQFLVLSGILFCPGIALQAQSLDRVKGAVMGAALGDALGRVTEFIDTTDAIKEKYGKQGVTSFESFTYNDWVVHPQSKQKIGAYTDDTVMSKIVLEVALKAQEKKWGSDIFIGELAKSFIELFGPKKYQIDPLFAVRAHGPTNINTSNVLAQLAQKPSGAQWWWRGPKDYDSKQYQEVLKEGGCGSVMRAWPLGIVFAHDKELVHKLADGQSRLTHRHPMARAASAAIAVGVAHALEGASVKEVVTFMIQAAEKFDEAEKLYKPKAQKIQNLKKLSPELIAHDKLLTSDMIRYAVTAAREKNPEQVLGTTNDQVNYRSPQGFLLGWAADEAVAAAVYVFIRHSTDLKAALQESVNTPGDSDSIATLAGALVGAYSGIKHFEDGGFDYAALEDSKALACLAEQIVIKKIN